MNRLDTENWAFLGDLASGSVPELIVKHVERDPVRTDPSQEQDIDLASTDRSGGKPTSRIEITTIMCPFKPQLSSVLEVSVDLTQRHATVEWLLCCDVK
jgi:hypothetical protein